MAPNNTRDNFNSQRIINQDNSPSALAERPPTANRLERTNGLFRPYTPSTLATLNQDDSPTPALHHGSRVQSLRNQSAVPTPWPVPTPPSIGDNSSPWVRLDPVPPLAYNGSSRSSTSAPNSNSLFGISGTSTSRFIENGVILTPSSSGNLTPTSGPQYPTRPPRSTSNATNASSDSNTTTVANPGLGLSRLSMSSGPRSQSGAAKSATEDIFDSSDSDSDYDSDSDRELVIMGNSSSVRANASVPTAVENAPLRHHMALPPIRSPLSALPPGPRGVPWHNFSRLPHPLDLVPIRHRRRPSFHSSDEEAMPMPSRRIAGSWETRLARSQARMQAATANSQPSGYPHRPRQYGPPSNATSSQPNEGRQPQGFRPTWAAMRAKQGQAKGNDKDRAALKAMYGISPNYAGDPTIERNRSADIPDSENCALWITFLPPDVTHREILAEIRNMGRIWSVVISGPEPAKNHHTAAAKVVFFELGAAQKFYAMSCNPARRFKVRGHVTKVELNRIKTAQDNRRNNSRVLRIKGRPDVVNKDALTAYFKQKITFEVDEVITIVMNEDMGDVEYRFGSFGNQAELAYLALQREYDVGGIQSPYWEVQYGHDPCAPQPSAYN
ncbi:hypothetical protein GCG54_00005778 [Colletotrichum gloeosporioides]|uniref:RRM domain-containing protein n=1 Tax=Colletotrichum gloeosporioides TaxID=474922 RepID=A0A8H4CJC5_COLGL|nr:uncharacterized protein GCG54_00005778 [Colletotrichum gloeosporioides]KAF3805033.1 hypothetical protein GCG54_00005778 [Colletotrichum gloeosporioides]